MTAANEQAQVAELVGMIYDSLVALEESRWIRIYICPGRYPSKTPDYFLPLLRKYKINEELSGILEGGLCCQHDR